MLFSNVEEGARGAVLISRVPRYIEMMERAKALYRILLGYPVVYWLTPLILILLDVLAIAFGWLDDWQIVDLKFDIFQLVLEIAVIWIVGGLVKRAVDAQETLMRFREDVLSNLGEIHGQVYVLRRKLALEPNDPEIVRRGVFELMELRSRLGHIGHEVRLQEDVGQRRVLHELATIRNYFEELIDEAMALAKDGRLTIGPKLERFIVGCLGEVEVASATYQLRFKVPWLRATRAADPSWNLTEQQFRSLDLEPER